MPFRFDVIKIKHLSINEVACLLSYREDADGGA